MKLTEETVIKKYRENDILIKTIKQFYYDTEEEKAEHCKEMERDGYNDSGQVKKESWNNHET